MSRCISNLTRKLVPCSVFADGKINFLFVVTFSLLATCSADQTCKIWRTSNFSLMTELSIKSNNPGETSRGWMWDCAFSGDSQYIVTGQYT